jgi:hypothetical protein
MTMLARDTIIQALHTRLEPDHALRAAWLGGSDANNRTDSKSDIDLFLIVEPGMIEHAAAAVERAILSLSPIRIRYRLPMPTWHGFEQAFYQLENAPEHTMVDWLIVEKGRPHPWLEVERHGTPRVLFDKDNLARPVHMNRAAISAAAGRKVAELRLKFPLLKHIPIKLVERGLPVDAAYFYQALIMRSLVDLMRAIHCPDKHDFGFRYVRDELPAECAKTLERLMYPAGPSDIPGMVGEAAIQFEKLLYEGEHRTV